MFMGLLLSAVFLSVMVLLLSLSIYPSDTPACLELLNGEPAFRFTVGQHVCVNTPRGHSATHVLIRHIQHNHNNHGRVFNFKPCGHTEFSYLN